MVLETLTDHPELTGCPFGVTGEREAAPVLGVELRTVTQRGGAAAQPAMDSGASLPSSDDLEQFTHAFLWVARDLRTGPTERPHLARGKPTVALRVSRALLLGLVALMAVKLDRDHSPVVKDQEVQAEA